MTKKSGHGPNDHLAAVRHRCRMDPRYSALFAICILSLLTSLLIQPNIVAMVLAPLAIAFYGYGIFRFDRLQSKTLEYTIKDNRDIVTNAVKQRHLVVVHYLDFESRPAILRFRKNDRVVARYGYQVGLYLHQIVGCRYVGETLHIYVNDVAPWDVMLVSDITVNRPCEDTP